MSEDAAYSQTGTNNFIIDVWDTDAGLPQNSVISMVRTRDGYLWLGTVNGLVRFDGVGRRTTSSVGAQFPVFDERNTPGLGSSLIVKLFEDSRGDLWIGTETAGVVRVREGRIERIELGQGSREGRLVSITEDQHGAIWLLTADGQLARHASGGLQSWQTDTYPSGYRGVIADDSGLLLLATDRSLMVLEHSAAATNGTPTAVQEMTFGRLDFILASQTGGNWRLANGRIQKWRGNRMERDLGAYPWERTSRVYVACEDPAGNLVVGTDAEGLFWFGAHGGFVQLSRKNGLSYNTILSLMADREGNLWVGTDGGGLNRVRQQVFQVMEPSRELVVRSVTQDTHEGIWVGYNRPQIDYWNAGQVTTYSNTHGLLDYLYVRSVLVDRDQQLWVGTLGRGLLRFSGGLFLSALDTDFLRRDREVCALFEDSAGHLWVGTAGLLAQKRGQTWTTYGAAEGLRGGFIRAISEDPNGNLWIGNEGGGLAILKDGRFIAPTALPEAAEPLPTRRESTETPNHRTTGLWTKQAKPLLLSRGGKRDLVHTCRCGNCRGNRLP
jgi:ligand-binding sensor domain-containing protein